MSDIEGLYPFLGEYNQHVQGRVTWSESELVIRVEAIGEKEWFHINFDDWFFLNFYYRQTKTITLLLHAHVCSSWDSVQFVKFRAKEQLNCRFMIQVMFNSSPTVSKHKIQLKLSVSSIIEWRLKTEIQTERTSGLTTLLQYFYSKYLK